MTVITSDGGKGAAAGLVHFACRRNCTRAAPSGVKRRTSTEKLNIRANAVIISTLELRSLFIASFQFNLFMNVIIILIA